MPLSNPDVANALAIVAASLMAVQFVVSKYRDYKKNKHYNLKYHDFFNIIRHLRKKLASDRYKLQPEVSTMLHYLLDIVDAEIALTLPTLSDADMSKEDLKIYFSELTCKMDNKIELGLSKVSFDKDIIKDFSETYSTHLDVLLDEVVYVINTGFHKSQYSKAVVILDIGASIFQSFCIEMFNKYGEYED